MRLVGCFQTQVHVYQLQTARLLLVPDAYLSFVWLKPALTVSMKTTTLLTAFVSASKAVLTPFARSQSALQKGQTTDTAQYKPHYFQQNVSFVLSR